MRKLLLSVISLALCTTPNVAIAAQTLFLETSDGWFVYKEDHSCVAYADFLTTTMLRFSDRTDEKRIYFSAYNPNWEHLRPLLNRTLTITLEFNRLQRVYGTAALVVENSDGRMGLSGADLGNAQILMALAGSQRMKLGIMYPGSKQQIIIEEFDLAGGDKAVLALGECSEEHFK